MPFGWLQIESPLPPQDCADRLRKNIDPSDLLALPAAEGTKPVFGYVEDGWFELRQRGPRNESGLNALLGQFMSGGQGTIVRFRCAWDDGPKWAGWLSVVATVIFCLGTVAFIAFAYLIDLLPGPRPYAWALLLIPAVVFPATIICARRSARIARQQKVFLVTFLEHTVKALGKPSGDKSAARC